MSVTLHARRSSPIDPSSSKIVAYPQILIPTLQAQGNGYHRLLVQLFVPSNNKSKSHKQHNRTSWSFSFPPRVETEICCLSFFKYLTHETNMRITKKNTSTSTWSEFHQSYGTPGKQHFDGSFVSDPRQYQTATQGKPTSLGRFVGCLACLMGGLGVLGPTKKSKESSNTQFDQGRQLYSDSFTRTSSPTATRSRYYSTPTRRRLH